MNLGLNLSFAVKRWLEPEYLANMLREELEVKHIQFTWDLLDPWWPREVRDRLARQWGDAFRREGLILDGTFGGLAAYTYPQLLAPTTEQSAVSVQFFKRAIDMTIAMGATSIGTPVGGMSYQDARDEKIRDKIYYRALDSIRELAAHGKSVGLEKIVIEPTPLFTEFPGTPENCQTFMQDLQGTTDIPVLLLLDWGHALMEPYLGEDADVEKWLDACGPYIDCFHLQQCDGQLDRHWGFTQEGIIDVGELNKTLEKYNLDNLLSFVEVVYPFEMTDEDVFADIKATMRILRADWR